MQYRGSDWIFLEEATALGGRDFRTSNGSWDVMDAGGVQETIVVSLRKEYLEKRSDEGLDIRVSGSKGHVIIKLPGYYVSGLMKKI